jgi:hypothetical protein
MDQLVSNRRFNFDLRRFSLARLAWHTRDLPNGSPYAFSIGEGTQLIVSGKRRLAPEAGAYTRPPFSST